MNTNPPKVIFPRTHSLWFGFTLPYLALKLIFTNKSLFFWSALPMVLTFILFIFVISELQDWAIKHLQDYVTSLGFSPDSWIIGCLLFGQEARKAGASMILQQRMESILLHDYGL